MRHCLLEVNPAERLAARVRLGDDPVAAGVEDLFLRRHLVLYKRRRACDNLKGRARRILSRNRLVVHGVKRVVVQDIPVLRGDAARKEIRVECGAADHGKHLARLRVHDDSSCRVRMDDGKLLIDGALRRLLDVLVDGEDEIIARHRRLTSEDLHGPSRYIDLHLIAALDAANILIVDAFQSELADDVAGFIPLVLALFKLHLVDFAHVAKDVCRILAVYVVTHGKNLDDDTGIVVLLLLDNGNDIGQNIILDADGIKADVSINLLLNLGDGNIDEL